MFLDIIKHELKTIRIINLLQKHLGACMILVISKTILKNSSGTVKKFSKVILFNCFAGFWPNGYQRGSLGKSHQNGDYLKEAMRKSCLPTGFEPAILIIKSQL